MMLCFGRMTHFSTRNFYVIKNEGTILDSKKLNNSSNVMNEIKFDRELTNFLLNICFFKPYTITIYVVDAKLNTHLDVIIEVYVNKNLWWNFRC